MILKGKEISKRFDELNNGNDIICTQAELDSFLMSGLIVKAGDSKYLTMKGQMVKIDVVKDKAKRMTIDFGGLLSQCSIITAKSSNKKVYFMSDKCYNNYDQQGLIIHDGLNDYYRLFEKELWLVYKI